MKAPGYIVGPVLPAGERPWPIGWEQNPEIDECPHEWETVLLAADGERRTRIEEVVRCHDCHTPRCGHTMDNDPCDLRRHHLGGHVPLSAIHIPPLAEDPVYWRLFRARNAVCREETP